MMTPGSEERVINLLGEIHYAQQEHGKTLSKLDHTINGNGHPGLKTLVDRHEQSLKWLRRVGWAVLAPSLAALGVGFMNLTHRQGATRETTPSSFPVPGTQPGSGRPGESGMQSLFGSANALGPSPK